MVELLAPAGSFESLCAAVNAGADAVYIGGTRFGARAYAENPDQEHLLRGIEYCHLRGRKLYMTVNTLLREDELEGELYDYLLPYYLGGLDGVIVQDFGVLRYLRRRFPGLELHASTQMTVTGPDGARLLQGEGVTRVVPARELSLKEVRAIIEETGIEVETFIHGAMCYSYSGQCLLSSMIGGRSGNRGRCAQPCRLPYRVETSPGRADGGGAAKGARYDAPPYVLSMKDMCTLDLLPDLLDAGIASLKIEGRMKRAEYTAGVVSVYRKYIDLYEARGREGCRVAEDDRRLLQDLYNRGGFSDGYYRHHNGPEMMAMARPNHQGTEAATVKQSAKSFVQASALEPLRKGDVLELDGDREVTLSADVKAGASFRLRQPGPPLRTGRVIYRTKNETLLRELNESYIKRNCKEKIKGDLRIFGGAPAILKLWDKTVGVTVTASVAQPAQTNPTAQDDVRRQLMKTGSTPFEFESLSIAMDENLFVPLGALNELRRTGLERLEQAVLERSRRKVPESGSEDRCEVLVPPECGERIQSDSEDGSALLVSAKDEGEKQRDEKGGHTSPASQDTAGMRTQDAEAVRALRSEAAAGWRLTVSIMSREQLDAVLSVPDLQIDTVYLDTSLFCELGDSAKKQGSRGLNRAADAEKLLDSLHAAGIKSCINCPPVFRERERRLFGSGPMQSLMALADGFLLHTVEELAYFKSYTEARGSRAELIADDSLYAWNREAERFLREHGVSRSTLPAELNFRELRHLDTHARELTVYGYQALMQSAQCVQKNTSGCTHRPGVLYLRDRKNACFPVQNRCAFCCNTIYNSVPLQLLACGRELSILRPSHLRLSFTVESAQETYRVAVQYRSLTGAAAHTDFERKGTRGHFKRGVE